MTDMNLGFDVSEFFHDREICRNENAEHLSGLLDKLYTEMLAASDEWFNLFGYHDRAIDEMVEKFLGIVSVLEDEGLLNGHPRSY